MHDDTNLQTCQDFVKLFNPFLQFDWNKDKVK